MQSRGLQLFVFSWCKPMKKPRSLERGFFNDVCLAANDAAYAGDVGFA